MKREPFYSDEDLVGLIHLSCRQSQKADPWVTVLWKDSTTKGGFLGWAQRGQLKRLADAGKLRVRTLSVSYWSNSYRPGSAAQIIQAAVPEDK